VVPPSQVVVLSHLLFGGHAAVAQATGVITQARSALQSASELQPAPGVHWPVSPQGEQAPFATHVSPQVASAGPQISPNRHSLSVVQVVVALATPGRATEASARRETEIDAGRRKDRSI
jgi:hypothetical protein